jgi:hypothetical protein
MMLLQVNLWAVLCSTASAFVVGALWYSVLFGKPWAEVSGQDAATKRPPGVVYPTVFALNLAASFLFGWLFRDLASFGAFLLAGLGAGVGLVALSYAINYLGAGRRARLIIIDGGFQIVRLTLFGFFFGILR